MDSYDYWAQKDIPTAPTRANFVRTETLIWNSSGYFRIFLIAVIIHSSWSVYYKSQDSRDFQESNRFVVYAPVRIGLIAMDCEVIWGGVIGRRRWQCRMRCYDAYYIPRESENNVFVWVGVLLKVNKIISICRVLKWKFISTLKAIESLFEHKQAASFNNIQLQWVPRLADAHKKTDISQSVTLAG